jgi:two-component system response regulator
MEILLVEDNPADVFLVREALKQTHENTLSVVTDGQEALSFVHQEGIYANARRPDLIFLDLNLPKKDGCAVLTEIKEDFHLRHIPIVIFTSSAAARDICQAYALFANSYIVKPMGLDDFLQTVRDVVKFWSMTASLPS